MDYAEFRKIFNVYKNDIYHDMLVENRDVIRVKKEHTVVKNLEKIFEATLKISNKKGFQAMTMRNLSKESGLSMGALYAYFSNKDELIEMLRRQHGHIMFRIFEDQIKPDMDPEAKLNTAIRTHLYLSEAMQPWFYFAYMETKNMSRAKQEKAMVAELASEKIFSDILLEGQVKKEFASHSHELAASLIKAVLQDWYLKRWKYRGRNISVDQYADFVTRVIARIVLKPTENGL
jgi:TetR/AcrR family transcriptional regulator, cholesterol catabolism regulator